jgi:hypothetical protein
MVVPNLLETYWQRLEFQNGNRLVPSTYVHSLVNDVTWSRPRLQVERTSEVGAANNGKDVGSPDSPKSTRCYDGRARFVFSHCWRGMAERG